MGYVAKPFVAGTPEAKVLGQTVIAFSENLMADEVKPLLPKHGLDNIDPEAWYPHQNWLNVLKDLEQTDSASTTFVAFGKKVVETAAMPPEMKTIPDVLNALHAIHHMNLQNIPEEEGYFIEKIADNHYHVHHNTPNPEEAIYGFIWGLAARFRAQGEDFVVKLLEDVETDKGRSVYEVRWGSAV